MFNGFFHVDSQYHLVYFDLVLACGGGAACVGQKKTESMKPARLIMSVTIEYGSGGSPSYGLARYDTHIFVTPWAGGLSIVKCVLLVIIQQQHSHQERITTVVVVVVNSSIHSSLRAGENLPVLYYVTSASSRQSYSFSCTERSSPLCEKQHRPDETKA